MTPATDASGDETAGGVRTGTRARLHLLRHAVREAHRIGVDGEPEILVPTSEPDSTDGVGIPAGCPTDFTTAFGGGGTESADTDIVVVDIDDCCVRYRRIGSQLDCLAGNIESLKFDIAPDLVRTRQSGDRVSRPVVLPRFGYVGGFDTDETIKVALFALSYRQDSDTGMEEVTVSTRCFDVEVLVTVQRPAPGRRDEASAPPFEVSLTYLDHGAENFDRKMWTFDLWRDQSVTLSNALIRLAMLVFDLAPTLRAAETDGDEQRLLVVGHPLRQQGFRYGATVIRCAPDYDRHSITTLGHGLTA